MKLTSINARALTTRPMNLRISTGQANQTRHSAISTPTLHKHLDLLVIQIYLSLGNFAAFLMLILQFEYNNNIILYWLLFYEKIVFKRCLSGQKCWVKCVIVTSWCSWTVVQCRIHLLWDNHAYIGCLEIGHISFRKTTCVCSVN